MDIGNAVLVVAAVIGFTELVKRATAHFGVVLPGWAVQIVSGSVAVGGMFLVRETVWANEQVIGGHPLDRLDAWSIVLAGILVGLGANVGDRLLKTVANIGQNTTRNWEKPPQ